jgi:hypothetical protein
MEIPVAKTTPTTSTPATDRAYAAFLRTAGNAAKLQDRLIRERRAAIGELVDLWLEGQKAEVLADLFFTIEVEATTAQQKKIATHPQRPASVEARVQAERARRAAAKAEATMTETGNTTASN